MLPDLRQFLDDKLQNEQEDSSSQSYLLNCFLPKDDKFIEESNKFLEKIKSGEDIQNIDVFYSLAINQIISNLFSNQSLDNNDKEKYKYLCDYFDKNIGLKLNNNLKNLLSLFFKEYNFYEIFKPKYEKQKFNIKAQDEEIFECLLYGLRFCVQSLLKENNSQQKYLYSSILNEKCFDNIQGSYIPGNDIKKNLKLETFKNLKESLLTYPAIYGQYICSCGYYYVISPPGFPCRNRSFNCPNCNLPLGGGEKILKDKGASNHAMAVRPGHYRIFKDENDKKEQMSKWNDPDENIPNKTLDQYKKDTIDPLLNICKGFEIITKEDFLDKNKSRRNLSKIGYRLLNYILYNHLFFSNYLGYISDEDLKNNFLVKGMNCLDIIKSNWDLLEINLKEKKIYSIQAFMNLIFKDLSEIISDCKYLESEFDLIQFETNFEKLIKANIEKYPEYEIEYSKLNKELISKIATNIKNMLKDLFITSEDIYPENEYPFLKYFIYTEYPSISDFIKDFEEIKDYKLNYPLLYNYINYITGSKENKIKYLEYIPSFNEFSNIMIKSFSNRITREEAKNIVFEKTPEYLNNKPKFESFQKIWNKIYIYATKYKCSEEMTPKILNSEDKIIYFLNDDNELGYGMYIASAFQNFISWQNEFLFPILESNNFKGNLFYLLENIKKKEKIQEAQLEQILSIDNCFKNSEYNNLDDLVYFFSKRNIYINKTGKINYGNYNKFCYDYSKIEEELGKIILPGKCLFKSEEELNFMNYWEEGFKGNQNETIIKFYYKYPQFDLNKEKKQNIISIITEYIENEKYEIKQFYSSLKNLIMYLSNNNFIPDSEIKLILNEQQDGFSFDEKFLKFF